MSQRVRCGVTDDFKREAVRLTQTKVRTIRQGADDLGIGPSTVTRWKRRQQDAELLTHLHADVGKELARLRRENELPRQQRDRLRKRTVESTDRGNRVGFTRQSMGGSRKYERIRGHSYET